MIFEPTDIEMVSSSYNPGYILRSPSEPAVTMDLLNNKCRNRMVNDTLKNLSVNPHFYWFICSFF